MYTRRYPSAPRRPITPPPDYSGTALRPPISAKPTEDTFVPPPPALPDENEVAPARPTAIPTPPSQPKAPVEDPRLSGGASKRPDLAAAPSAVKRRFTLRSPSRGKIPLSAPKNLSRRPFGIRADEKGYRIPHRGVLSAMASLPSQSWALDDLLLLGLLFLLLNGGEEDVRSHLDVIVLLGFLFFVGLIGQS